MSALVANAFWPALLLEEEILTVPAVGAGLAIEFAVLRLALRMPWLRAAKTAFLMNAASAMAGVVLLPVAGGFWEASWELLGGRSWEGGTLAYGAHWMALLAIAATLNTVLETPFLPWIGRVPVRGRAIAWMFATNAVTVGIALTLLYLANRAYL